MNDPTIPANGRYVQAVYHKDGTLSFSFDFPVYEPASVQLYVNNAQWAFTEDYSVTIVNNSGGFVNLLKEPMDGALLTIVGATPYVRTETYVPPTADVATLNVECTKTIYRLQQLNRDIYGCLKNIREETEAENTELPRTADRKGHLATWGTNTGRLTYAGDPDEGGDDPTADFLKKSLNLSDIPDVPLARQNLGVIQGHAVNGQIQRPNLFFTGDGIDVYDSLSQDATVVQLVQAVKTFNDLLGLCPIAKGGTGANNVIDAKKNLLLSNLATTGEFRDLKNVPYIISNIVNVGNGAPIGGTILNGIATLRTLTSSDKSLAIGQTANSNAVDLKVGNVPADRITGVLEPNQGGTGLGTPEMAAANPGDVLAVSPDHRWTTANIPRGHVISDNGELEPQRPILRFQGDFLTVTDAPGETIVHFGDFPRGDVYDFAVCPGDFIGNRLTIHSAQLPLEITGDIIVQTYNGERFYTDCSIRVFPLDRIEIVGNPFDGNALIYSGNDGNFASVSFTSSDFVEGECIISNSRIGFFPTRAIVQCVFNEGSYLEHVNVALAQVGGDVLISSAMPFNGKLLVRGGKPQLDSYYTHNIDSQDFVGDTLTIPAEDFPFPLIRPLISIQDIGGQWINCSVRIPEHGSVTITAEPFNGGFTVLQGIRALWAYSLEILNPDGLLMPREPRLQFTGDVAVSDDMVAGKTVVRVFGDSGPVEAEGDLIVGTGPGAAERLPIGTQDQALMVDGGMPTWKDLGAAAFLDGDIPGGVVVLDQSGLIPEERLPIGSLSYKGTFGTPTSTTGGDLPTDAHDGDLYDCAATADYFSEVAELTFHPAQQTVYVATTGWVARPCNDNGDPTKADVDASNLTTPNLASWKNRLEFNALALVDGSNLDADDISSWQNVLQVNQKAAADASNLTTQDIAAWQDTLGVTPSAGGEYVPVGWNTVYAPEAYDRMVIVARRPSGWGSQTIFIGDTSDAVNQIIARMSVGTDRNVGRFCSAKVPGGKYFKIATDGTSYGADYNFMIRM